MQILFCVVDGLCLQRTGVFYIYTEQQIFIIGSFLHWGILHLYRTADFYNRFFSALPAPVPLYFDGVTLKR